MSPSWGDRGGEFERKPGRSLVKYGIILLLVLFALGIVAGVGNFACGWFNKAGEVAGPENVDEQYTAVIEDWNAMEAAAQNACGAEQSGASERDPQLLEDPSFAYEATYRRIAVDFNRRQANIFEANKVGPPGYPDKAPDLEETQAKVC